MGSFFLLKKNSGPFASLPVNHKYLFSRIGKEITIEVSASSPQIEKKKEEFTPLKQPEVASCGLGNMLVVLKALALKSKCMYEETLTKTLTNSI